MFEAESGASPQEPAGEHSLAGRMLIATPSIGDPRFARSVIYMCAHKDTGAMGLIVNRAADDVDFRKLLGKLQVEGAEEAPDARVRFGGPVEVERGFVLHSPDYFNDRATLRVADGVCMTETIDALRAMASHEDAPSRALFALGYAGWGPGQLEREIRQNGWLICDADDDLVFDDADDTKWRRALGKIGVDPTLLSTAAGSA